VLEQFIDAIDRGRPELDRQEVRAVADGRIFSGEMAHAMGFADRIGSLDDAIAIAGDLAGLGEAPRIERVPVKQRLIDRILEERLGGLEALAGPRGRGWPQLEYRWR
jgi:protease-4